MTAWPIDAVNAFTECMNEREKLLAEVRRLTLADEQWADHVKRLVEERDRLNIEIKYLRSK